MNRKEAGKLFRTAQEPYSSGAYFDFGHIDFKIHGYLTPENKRSFLARIADVIDEQNEVTKPLILAAFPEAEDWK